VSQIADVEQAVVRRAVVTAESRAIHAKRDGQILQRHVMNDHVVGALHERRVDRQERLQPLRRETAGEERRVFLRNADIVVALRMLLLEEDRPVPVGIAAVIATTFLFESRTSPASSRATPSRWAPGGRCLPSIAAKLPEA
jgi:hypothetical protein